MLNTLYNDDQQAFSIYVKIFGFIKFATDKDFPHSSGGKMTDIDATMTAMHAAFKNILLPRMSCTKRNARRLSDKPHGWYMEG